MALGKTTAAAVRPATTSKRTVTVSMPYVEHVIAPRRQIEIKALVRELVGLALKMRGAHLIVEAHAAVAQACELDVALAPVRRVIDRDQTQPAVASLPRP